MNDTPRPLTLDVLLAVKGALRQLDWYTANDCSRDGTPLVDADQARRALGIINDYIFLGY